MSRFYFVLSILGSCVLLYSLYERIYAGEFIIETKHKGISKFYTGLLIFWIFSLGGFSILDYKNGENMNSNRILQGMFWIQLCLEHILSKRSLGIAEGGVYTGNPDYSRFTKWTGIKSYAWIEEDKIQLKTWGRMDKIAIKELEVEESQKEEVDKLLDEFINKKDNELYRRRSRRAMIPIILIGIVMTIGYITILKISY